MEHNRQNEVPGWQQRLNALSSLPGETMPATTELWERLSSRMETKPRKSRKIWYWAAAAVTLLMLPWLLMQQPGVKRDTAATDAGSSQPITQQPTPILPATHESATVMLTAPVGVDKPSPVFTAAAKTSPAKPVNNQQPVSMPVQKGLPAASPDTMVTTTAPETVTPATLAAAVEAPQRKLQVLHINEVGVLPVSVTAPPDGKRSVAQVAASGKPATGAGILPQANRIGFRINLSSKN